MMTMMSVKAVSFLYVFDHLSHSRFHASTFPYSQNVGKIDFLSGKRRNSGRPAI